MLMAGDGQPRGYHGHKCHRPQQDAAAHRQFVLDAEAGNCNIDPTMLEPISTTS